jgi:5-methylcytosine-specific restriction endonuclease McrA
MTKLFKKGDTRSDGYRFKQYKKKPDGSWREEWLSPKSFENAKNWHKRQTAKESQKRWNLKNLEKIRQYSRNHIAKNRQKSRERSRDYAKNNPEKRRSLEAERRARINKTYIPLSRDEKRTILSIYESATRITNCLGIAHHVDHIFPLSRGGEHLPKNLQIIPASINCRKRNRVNFCYDKTI